MHDLVTAALSVIDDVFALYDVKIDEAGKYYYDVENVKRWVTDGDACEMCEDNAERGWIGDDEVFEGVFGDVDEPPSHLHCPCTVEYKEKRVRVYI